MYTYTKMRNCILVSFACFGLLLSAGIVEGLQADENVLVTVVENGTEEAVVLDCPYTLDEEDRGLVVKWYYTQDPRPVYQWITGKEYVPQGLNFLKDRLDLEYIAKDDPNHKYRAMRILNPTTELTGDYKCHLSTFENDDEVYRKLVVFSRPTNVNIWATEEGMHQVLVVCEVEDTYPEPQVSLFATSEINKKRTMIEGVQITPSWERGLYDTKLEVVVEEDDLSGYTHFECLVTIPDTDVHVSNGTHYEPRVKVGAVVSGSEIHSAMSVVIGLAFLAVWRF